MVSCNIYGNTGLGLAPLCPRHNFALLPHPTPPTCLFVAYLPWGLVQGLYTGGGQLRWVQACCLTPVHSNTQPRTPTHIPTQRPPILSCVSPLPRTRPAGHLVVHKQKSPALRRRRRWRRVVGRSRRWRRRRRRSVAPASLCRRRRGRRWLPWLARSLPPTPCFREDRAEMEAGAKGSPVPKQTKTSWAWVCLPAGRPAAAARPAACSTPPTARRRAPASAAAAPAATASPAAAASSPRPASRSLVRTTTLRRLVNEASTTAKQSSSRRRGSGARRRGSRSSRGRALSSHPSVRILAACSPAASWASSAEPPPP